MFKNAATHRPTLEQVSESAATAPFVKPPSGHGLFASITTHTIKTTKKLTRSKPQVHIRAFERAIADHVVRLMH
jgi:hypothetical protein